MIDVGLWYLFPLSVFVATIAMMTGIGGAVMFSPVFMLLLGLDAVSAFATGLFVELFGFTSGVVGYLRKRLIDFSLVRKIALITIPSVIVGVILARFLPMVLLKVVFASLLLYLSVSFLTQKKKCNPKHPSCNHLESVSQNRVKKNISFSILFSSALGGALLGSISSGLGEINEYNFLKKLKLPLSIASGTSVFLVAISAFVGVLIHVITFFINNSVVSIIQMASMLLFVLPGVVLGAQLGVLASQKVDLDRMDLFVGGLFFILCILVIITMF